MVEQREDEAGLLYVDDEAANLKLFALQLGDDFHLHVANSGAEALDVLKNHRIGVVASDERMPGMSGVDLLAKVAAQYPIVSRVIISAYNDAPRLLRAINTGRAHEYILKPWDLDDLRERLGRQLSAHQRRRYLEQCAHRIEVEEEDGRRERPQSWLIGGAPPFTKAVALAKKAAASDVTILLRGETGTGKELFARLIHEHSERSRRPFIRVNCAALAEGVLESELFGHERGAFTGASSLRKGRFELAHTGTLFLDEIGDIAPRFQVDLLRALQERIIERVGSAIPIPVNVRVVAATHRDLEDAIRQGTFRQDLFYRLKVFEITVPPLRDRRQDIEPLIDHFIDKHAVGPRPRLATSTLDALKQYDWPGNIRELENLVQRALITCDGEELTVDDFTLLLDPSIPSSLQEVRRQADDADAKRIRAAIVSAGGNLSLAARRLGLARSTLRHRARKLGLS